MATRFIIILYSIIGLWSCGDNCDQDFFFVDLTPRHTLTSECISVGESFNITLEYPDTLRAFSGVIETIFDTIYTGGDTSIQSRQEEEINVVDIKNYQFVTSISIHLLVDSIDNFDSQPKSFESFEFSVLKGEVATDNFDSGNFFSVMPDRVSSVSSLDISVTPLKVGSYYLSIIHGNAGVYEDVIVFDGCDDLILASYQNTDEVNENVLFQATDSSYLSGDKIEELVNTKALFFFKVLENGAQPCF